MFPPLAEGENLNRDLITRVNYEIQQKQEGKASEIARLGRIPLWFMAKAAKLRCQQLESRDEGSGVLEWGSWMRNISRAPRKDKKKLRK